MEAIPIPVRERIIKLYEQGKQTRQIADALGYCAAAVRRVRQHFKERGTLKPQTHLCGRHGYFTQQRQEHLRTLILQKPDSTLKELCRQMDVQVAVSTMDTWTRRLGLSFKKSPSMPPSRIARTSHKNERNGITSLRISRRKSSYSSTNQASRPT